MLIPVISRTEGSKSRNMVMAPASMSFSANTEKMMSRAMGRLYLHQKKHLPHWAQY
jgi:hypothetical protein